MEIFSNGGIISLSEMDIFESRLGDGGEHKEQDFDSSSAFGYKIIYQSSAGLDY